MKKLKKEIFVPGNKNKIYAYEIMNTKWDIDAIVCHWVWGFIPIKGDYCKIFQNSSECLAGTDRC